MNQALTRELTTELEKVIIGGDLRTMTPAERLNFYNATCQSLGLNPLTRPFEYITLNNKLTLYARKDATEQLRKIHSISVTKLEREIAEGVYVVTAYMSAPDGRTDSSIGAVSIDGLKGEARANAMMKSETKAKRRGTLSICGLGILDETEVETIPSAQRFEEKGPSPVELPSGPPVTYPVERNGATTYGDTELELAKKALRDLMQNQRFSDAQREVAEEWLGKATDVKKIKQKMRAQSVWLEDVRQHDEAKIIRNQQMAGIDNPDADPLPAAEGQAF